MSRGLVTGRNAGFFWLRIFNIFLLRVDIRVVPAGTYDDRLNCFQFLVIRIPSVG